MATYIICFSEPASHRSFGSGHWEEAHLQLRRRFEIEGHLCHLGISIVGCLAASFYRFLVRAFNSFLPATEYERRLAKAFSGTKTPFSVVSLTFDWLLPAAGDSGIAHAHNVAGSLVVPCGDRDHLPPRRVENVLCRHRLTALGRLREGPSGMTLLALQPLKPGNLLTEDPDVARHCCRVDRVVIASFLPLSLVSRRLNNSDSPCSSLH